MSTQPVAPSGYTSPSALSSDQFNPGVSFNGSSDDLRGATSSSMFTGANSYIFGVSYTALFNPSNSVFAAVLSGWIGNCCAAQGIAYRGASYDLDTDYATASGPFTTPTATPIVSDVFYSTAGNKMNSSTSENALTAASSLSNSTYGASQFEIGGRTSAGGGCCQYRIWNGQIDEVVNYNSLATALTTTQISQIRSYRRSNTGSRWVSTRRHT